MNALDLAGEREHDLAAVGLVADDDDGLAAAGRRRRARRRASRPARGRSSSSSSTSDAPRDRLGRLAGAQQRARDDGVEVLARQARAERRAPRLGRSSVSGRSSSGSPGSPGAALAWRTRKTTHGPRVDGLRPRPGRATISTSSWTRCCSIARSTPTASYSRRRSTTWSTVPKIGGVSVPADLLEPAETVAQLGFVAADDAAGHHREAQRLACRLRAQPRRGRACARAPRRPSAKTVLYSSAYATAARTVRGFARAADDDRRSRLLQRLRPDRRRPSSTGGRSPRAAGRARRGARASSGTRSRRSRARLRTSRRRYRARPVRRRCGRRSRRSSRAPTPAGT